MLIAHICIYIAFFHPFLIVYLNFFNHLLSVSLVGRVFTKGLGDLGSIPDHFIPKDFKNGT